MSLLSLLPTGACMAAAPCAETIRGLKALIADPAFPLRWRETSMDDGKPLLLSIHEKDGLLFLEFSKTGEGLWAEGASVICRNGAELEARIAADQVRMGAAARWTARLAMLGGSQFILTRIGGEQLRIATPRWSGTFSSNPPR